MGDSTRRAMLAIVLLLAIACLLWFVFVRDTGQSTKQQSPISQLQKPPATPVVKAPDNPADTNAAVQNIQAVTVPQTDKPAIAPAQVATPDVELITGDIQAEKDVFKEPYIKRSRPIAINPQILEKDGKLVAGSRLALTLFPDAKYAVTMQQVNRTPQGDFSASGKLDGEEYGTFVLSAASGVVIMRLADPPAKKLFLIRSHGPNKTQYVVEIDPTKVPIPKHGVTSDVRSNNNK